MAVELLLNMEVEDVGVRDDFFENVLQRLLALAAQAEGLDAGEVTLTFVDDAAIQVLNRDYRGFDKPTDVLSFAIQEDVEDGDFEITYEVDSLDELVADEGVLGDIVISVDTARRQADELGHSLERELAFLLVHGFLHLMGYDHPDEASEAVMTAKQEAALGAVGLSR